MCDLNLHLEIGFFNACLVLDSFLMTTQDISGGQVFFTYSPWTLVNVKFTAAQLFIVLLQTMLTRWQHSFMPLFFPL